MMGAFMSALGSAGRSIADGAGLLKDYASSAKDWGVDVAKDASGALDKYGDEFMKAYNQTDTSIADKYKGAIGDHQMVKDIDKIVTDTEKFDYDKYMAEKGKIKPDMQDFSTKSEIPVDIETGLEDDKDKGGIYGALSRAMMNENTKDKKDKSSGPTPPSLMSARGPSIQRGSAVGGGKLGLGNATARDFLRNRFTNSKR